MSAARTIRPGDPMSLLTAARRRRERDELANGHVVDLLVIGGGVTGVGVALDAATRGLDVALIEAHDYAFGTSRWSSKMIHGGLRYLATGKVGVAWESAVERACMERPETSTMIRSPWRMVAGSIAPPLMDSSRLETERPLAEAPGAEYQDITRIDRHQRDGATE